MSDVHDGYESLEWFMLRWKYTATCLDERNQAAVMVCPQNNWTVEKPKEFLNNRLLASSTDPKIGIDFSIHHLAPYLFVFWVYLCRCFGQFFWLLWGASKPAPGQWSLTSQEPTPTSFPGNNRVPNSWEINENIIAAVHVSIRCYMINYLF